MTANDFIQSVTQYQNEILIYFAVIPLLAFLFALVTSRKMFETGVKYIYSALIYLSFIPGTVSLVLVLYSLFFLKMNLLHANVLVYFLPIVSMIITIIFIKKKVSLKAIPGFERLSGIMVVTLITLGLIYLLQKMFVGVIFFASIKYLILLFIIVFVILKLSLKKL